MIDVSRIASIFDRFTTGWHFYLRDLRTGEDVEMGIRHAWPIGSCFKLAVLVAYFEAVSDGTLAPASLDQETLIAAERFRVGGGIVNLLDSPIRLTDRHMLQWMLTASDGTATDVLIAKLGLERVDATLRRLAPSSHLACDLGDMVTAFRSIPGALDCKTRDWTMGEADQFRVETAKLGATNAVDLAELALGAFTFSLPPRGLSAPYQNNADISPDGDVHPVGAQGLQQEPRLEPGRGDPADGSAMSASLRTAYQRCLASGRLFPRAATFVATPWRYFTKGGSLGRCYFFNEGGVVIDPASETPIASFAYCSQGWRLPGLVVETAGGLIGVEIARALGITPPLNADWTPEGADLLLRDL